MKCTTTNITIKIDTINSYVFIFIPHLQMTQRWGMNGVCLTLESLTLAVYYVGLPPTALYLL
jgi:hypothetical protein